MKINWKQNQSRAREATVQNIILLCNIRKAFLENIITYLCKFFQCVTKFGKIGILLFSLTLHGGTFESDHGPKKLLGCGPITRSQDFLSMSF